jgi:hypothetical protein
MTHGAVGYSPIANRSVQSFPKGIFPVYALEFALAARDFALVRLRSRRRM